MKSPSLTAAVQPLQKLDTDAHRTWTSDVTVEAIGSLLDLNPQGILIVKDELVGLVTSLNQYKNGKGSDRQFYLSAWSGASLRVDRKGGSGTAPLHLHVGRPFLSIVGCIQPDVLPSLKAGTEDGFVERLLFSWPESLPVRWRDESISKATKTAYSDLIEHLIGNDWPSRPDPVPLSLTPEAQSFWGTWHDHHMQESESVSPQLRGFYSKLKGYCARLALIYALGSDPKAEDISLASLQAAAAQIEFFKQEMVKVVGLFGLSVGRYSQEVERAREAILKGVKKHGGLTKRDAQRLQNYNALTFGSAWDSLITPSLILHEGKYILPRYRQTDRQIVPVMAYRQTDNPLPGSTDRQTVDPPCTVPTESLVTDIPTMASDETANTHGGTT